MTVLVAREPRPLTRHAAQPARDAVRAEQGGVSDPSTSGSSERVAAYLLAVAFAGFFLAVGALFGVLVWMM
jgi:hypothetical protein